MEWAKVTAAGAYEKGRLAVAGSKRVKATLLSIRQTGPVCAACSRVFMLAVGSSML